MGATRRTAGDRPAERIQPDVTPTFAGRDRVRRRRGRRRCRAELVRGHTGSGVAPPRRCRVRADRTTSRTTASSRSPGMPTDDSTASASSAPAAGAGSSATCRWTRSPPRTPSPTTRRTACCSRSTPAATPSPASSSAAPTSPGVQTVPSGGVFPVSVAAAHDRLYVLNAGGSGQRHRVPDQPLGAAAPRSRGPPATSGWRTTRGPSSSPLRPTSRRPGTVITWS